MRNFLIVAEFYSYRTLFYNLSLPEIFWLGYTTVTLILLFTVKTLRPLWCVKISWCWSISFHSILHLLIARGLLNWRHHLHSALDFENPPSTLKRWFCCRGHGQTRSWIDRSCPSPPASSHARPAGRSIRLQKRGKIWREDSQKSDQLAAKFS